MLVSEVPQPWSRSTPGMLELEAQQPPRSKATSGMLELQAQQPRSPGMLG